MSRVVSRKRKRIHVRCLFSIPRYDTEDVLVLTSPPGGIEVYLFLQMDKNDIEMC